MTKKETIEQIAKLIAEATAMLREAEGLATKNKVPFNFQLATLAGKELYDDTDRYSNGYPDNNPAVVTTEGFNNQGWDNSGLYC